MSLHRAAVFALVAALVAPQSFAQDLDVPMPSAGGKTKSKAGKSRASAKKGSAKKPAPVEDELDVPLPAPTKKPATAKKPAPVEDELDVPLPSPTKKPATAKKPAPLDVDEIPTVGKSELRVKLAGSVKGARLLVDNKDVGALPLSAPLQVEPGEHSLVVRRPGFADFSRRITAKGKPIEVPVTLEAVAGVVTVVAEPTGASVSINGQPRGEVPLNGVVLKPGSYEIVVSKEGFQPDTKNLSVKAGKDYTVTASLRPAETPPPTLVAGGDTPTIPVLTPPETTVTDANKIPLTKDEPEVSPSQPWFKRWYVWAGVGVVAAAAAGAVVATQGGTTPLTSDIVCGGRCDETINGLRAGGR
ncbi:PEGA domain-containing protein [Hyalangium sp.]|uniref:PEGA domain-containing protein n=1 Tax=Hyalangium sp. TaxID=2028555 RepID=UPI002D25AC58|nr:PEGA domain-containing protein [Hyalangium sp.]HYH99405.1 PEGA domain-containing protein [Hyalangium sp.]